MKRRAAGIALASFMYGVRAAKVPPRIGRLSEGGPATADTLDGFRKAMRELGHADVEIVSRHAGGQYGNLPGLAAELVALGVDVIWTAGTIATGAAKDATRTIPVVMVSADAVGSGLVDSMARPGGNVTGLTLIATELVRKRLELIQELARILDGAKPADLPVEQPTRYELLVNLKSARAMGLSVSQSLLLRADEVIE